MFAVPGTFPDFAHKLSRDAAERVASNWWMFLLNGLLLIVAGVLIFSIEWSVRSLATFIGVLFILEGVTAALTTGIDARVKRANVITALLSIAAGVAIIIWPGPGIVAVAIFLGAWLIVIVARTISRIGSTRSCQSPSANHCSAWSQRRSASSVRWRPRCWTRSARSSR
jgi:uncharacterized membrane protein HdeD (DUF308 family)